MAGLRAALSPCIKTTIVDARAMPEPPLFNTTGYHGNVTVKSTMFPATTKPRERSTSELAFQPKEFVIQSFSVFIPCCIPVTNTRFFFLTIATETKNLKSSNRQMERLHLTTWIRISHSSIIRMIRSIRKRIHANKIQSKPKLIFTIKYAPNPLGRQPSHRIPHIDLSDYQPVGIPEIDGDHRLITLMFNGIVNELNEFPSIDNESASQRISPLIYGIVEHFKVEEQEMAKVRYPSRFPHKAQHDYFLSEIANRIDSLKSGTSRPELLISFIGSWWEEHTVNSDSYFGKYLTGQRLPTSDVTTSNSLIK